jgi:putative flippase GtrA
MHAGKQFIVYSLIGILNTLVHFVVFVVLYRLFGVPLLVASTLGYCAGVANSYLMNRRWTFAVASAANTTEFSKFAVVNLVSLGLNLAVLRALSTLGLMPELAQAGAIVVSLGANFVGNKWWAFRGQ